MATERPFLPESVREILQRKGAIKPPKLTIPGVPSCDALIAWARKKGYGASVTMPIPDPEAEPEDQTAHAIVNDDEDAWEFFDMHPGVALASALAKALEAREPRQTTLLDEAAD